MICCGARADAATLYGATSAGSPGRLYTLDPATGAMIEDIGPLNDGSGLNYPMTGLAFHPLTGVLYGSTGMSGGNAATKARLVTIDPATAQVTVVGQYNAGPISEAGNPSTMTDLTFDAAGNLFGLGSTGGPQLYSINFTTGQATVIGDSEIFLTDGGGLEVAMEGVFYGTPTVNRFGTYNPVDGSYSNLANPDKPVGGTYAALSYDGNLLYGVNLGPPNDTVLVTISATGEVTQLGTSVRSLDAIAFQIVPEPSVAVHLTLSLAAFAIWRRGRA
jgi:hypothetical protein